MLFSQFAQHLQEIEGTSSRLEMTEQLSQLLQELESQEIPAACYLMQGQLVPTYQSLEFNLSTKMVIRALARLVEQPGQGSSTNLFGEEDNGQQEQAVTALYKKLGDVGLVAEELLAGTSAEDQLEILDVYQQLLVIARDQGQGSQERKVAQLVALLRQLDPLSAKFVARIVIGKLRLGFSTMTLLDALSWTMAGDKSETKQLEQAYQKKADVGLLAQNYLQEPAPAARQALLAADQVQVGIPIVPALCQRLNSAAEIIDKMGTVVAEPKYDGLRIQIHLQRGQGPRAFTRNLEDVSQMFPELDQAFDHIQADSVIIDAEAVGYDPTTNELVTFQQTSTRRRKHAVAEKAQEIPIRFYVFDILELNGTGLLSKKLRERKELLNNLFDKNEVFYTTPYIVTDDPKELRSFHEAQLGVGLEGAVMKQLDSVYQSGRKGWSWVKIKEEEGTTGKLKDTVDAVVMGYYFGRGKRTEFGIGAILVGLPDIQERIKTIAKIGTGLSDEQLREMKQHLDQVKSQSQPTTYDVHKNLVPDVWANPQVVIEVAADEITNSPNHTAGVALRFPRMLQIRDDKSPTEATTVAELAQIA